MRIAFYAPLKPPTHPHPSGDRRMARLLMRALRQAGHRVTLASTFRAYDRDGRAERQRRLARRGASEAAALVRRWRAQTPSRRPAAWVTYHLYHKAPDYLGPTVAASLGIPYVVIEPSVAPRKRKGPWALGYAAARAAIARADAALCLNSVDPACVRPALKPGATLEILRPFLDAGPFARCAGKRKARDGVVRLLAVGMMRPGDKLDSFTLLADALTRIANRPWRLEIVGDGVARDAVERLFAPLGRRVRFLGERRGAALPGIYARADLYVWPAIREAYGMAILEAQAAGLPVVAGRGVGVADIVTHGRTGVLVATDTAAAFADALRRLIDAPERRRRLAQAALGRVRAHHGLDAAARALDRTLRRVLRGARP